MKYFFIFFLTLLCYSLVAQQAVNYGNNPAAGKFYNVRGINMYCEIYGEGKPLLLIHGNGGSISAFRNN
ncbi:MAG: alpha/beta hydrolase, partial [Bacteroidetes bacterium]|nr:alpha/beta hydrolase [Bacteroidota bacterium]